MTSWVLGRCSTSEPARPVAFWSWSLVGRVRSALLCSVFDEWVGGKGLMRPVPVYRRILHFPHFSFAACFPGHPLFSTDPAAPRSRVSRSLTLWPCTPQPLSVARALSYQVPLRVTIFVYLASLSLLGWFCLLFLQVPCSPPLFSRDFQAPCPDFCSPWPVVAVETSRGRSSGIC